MILATQIFTDMTMEEWLELATRQQFKVLQWSSLSYAISTASEFPYKLWMRYAMEKPSEACYYVVLDENSANSFLKNLSPKLKYAAETKPLGVQ